MPQTEFERAAAGITPDARPYSLYFVYETAVDSDNRIAGVDLVLWREDFVSGCSPRDAIRSVIEIYGSIERLNPTSQLRGYRRGFQWVPDLVRQLGSCFELPMPPCTLDWAWLWDALGLGHELFEPWVGRSWTAADEHRVLTERAQMRDLDRRLQPTSAAYAEVPSDPIVKKSFDLLRQYLTRTQRSSLRKRGFFYVYTESGRRYRLLSKGRAGNVELCDGAGQPIRRYCAHPDQHVPMGDVLLAQKLHLEADEPGFIRVSNVHWTDERCRESLVKEDNRMKEVAIA